MTPYIILTPEQLLQARRVAEKTEAEKRGCKDNATADGVLIPEELSLEQRIYGIQAELAVALYLGVPWHTDRKGRAYYETYTGPDLETTLEVRATQVPQGHLIIRNETYDTHGYKFILVVVCEPLFLLKGWYTGTEARQHPDWYKTDDPRREPCYWVPQSALHPMDTLLQKVAYS